MKLSNLLILATVLLAFGLPAGASTLFSNNSFESTPCTIDTNGNNFLVLGPGSNCITGWSVVGGDVDIVGSGFWTAEDGNYSIELYGGVTQTVTTVPGGVYELSFWLAGNMNAPPVTKSIQVTIDGATENYTFNTTGATSTNMGWTEESFTFTATGTSATAEFLSTDDPQTAGGPVIDNVDLQLVTPEPGSIFLAAVGLGALIAAKVRR